MAFPTVPTTGANTLLSSTTTPASTTHTFPSLTTLAPAAGDLIIAICVQYQGGTANAEFGTWGASLTETADLATVTALDQAIGVAHKVASGSESGTFTVTSAHSFKSVNFLMRIPAATWHGTTIPEVAAAVRATNAVANPGSLDPANWAAEDTLWIAVYGHSETSTTGSPPTVDTPPTNYSGQLIVARAADAVGEITAGVAFYQNNASSEDAGTWTVTNATRGNGAATTIAIRPAPAPTLVPLATADAVSSATLNLAQYVPVAAATAASAATVALTAPTKVPLAASTAVSSATCVVSYPGTGIAARTFDLGTLGANIDVSIGSANLTGAYTIAAMVRLSGGSDGVVRYVVGNITSASANAVTLGFNTSNQLIVLQGFTPRNSTATVVRSDGWVLVAVTKAAGTATPKAHIYKASAWTHQNLSGTHGNPTSQAGGSVNFGFHPVFGGAESLDIAVVGEWTSELSDANIETLVTNWGTQDFFDLSPAALWNFNQAATTDDVLDLIGAADETAELLTSVSDDGPAGWDYDLATAAVVPLDAANGVSSATLALTAAAGVPLDPAASTSTATLALTAPAQLVLETASAVSSATLALTAPAIVPLVSASALSTATLALSAATKIPLGSSDAVVTATLVVTVAGVTNVPLDAAAATSAATLALTAPTKVVLQTSAAVSSATLNLAQYVPLATSAAQSAATLALTAQARVTLATSSAQSNATLALTAATQVPLATSSATSSATLSLTAQTKIALGSAAAVSSATLVVVTSDPYETEVLSDSPSLYWRLDETSGTNAADHSGNGNDGTYTDVPTGASYVLGQPGALACSANLAVQINDEASGSTTGAFIEGALDVSVFNAVTIEGWYFGDTGRSNPSDFMHGSVQAFANVAANGTTITFLIEGVSFVQWLNAWPGENRWVHWVLRMNQSASTVGELAANTAELFINGVSKGTRSLTANWSTGEVIHAANPYDAWGGRIDEFAIYPTALATARIERHYWVGSLNLTLSASTGTSSATLVLNAPALVPLATAAAVSSATLSLRALTQIPLDPASAVSTATCNVTSPGVAFLTLSAASGTATATLGLRATTKVALETASATSSATLSLTAPARVPLAATTATSSATLALTIVPSLVLTATATSSATLSLTAKTTIPIAASTATSSATLSLRAPSRLVLTADATSSATLVVTTSTQIPLEAVTASSSATMVLGILAAGTLVFAPCYATSSATLVVVGIDTSWHNDSDTSWPNQTDTSWPVGVEAGWSNDEGTVWPNSTDQDWS